jgi:hypothetical protein
MSPNWMRDRLAELDAEGLFRGANRDIDPGFGGRRYKEGKMLYLEIRQGNTRIGESYPIETRQDLDDAIDAEARTLARDADSEILEEGTDEERDRLEQETIDDATAHLLRAGDSYTDEAGYTWVLVEREED